MFPGYATDMADKGSWRSPELDRFEARTELAMLVLSIAIIPLLLAPLMFDLSRQAEQMVIALDWLLWGIFAIEYGIRLFLASSRFGFVKANLIDLGIVLLPFLRPLRVARSARALRVLRAARVLIFLGRATKGGRAVLTRHKLHYGVAISVVVVAGAAGWSNHSSVAPETRTSTHFPMRFGGRSQR